MLLKWLITGLAVVCCFIPTLSAQSPALIAHRGLLRHAPENTMAAFSACVDLGFGFELDLRTTADGSLVVLHDSSLLRTTGGKDARSLRDVALSELQQLDVGSWFDSAFQGQHVPTLREVLQLVHDRGSASTFVALNIKDIDLDGERQLVQLLGELNLFSRCFAFDQSEDCSRRLKQQDARVRIGRNVSRASLNDALEQDLVDCFLLTFVPTVEEVQRLRKAGRSAMMNYAGEQARSADVWERAALAGIDGLLTDYPLECRQVWREMTAADTVLKINEQHVWVETPWGVPVLDRGQPGSWDHMAVDNPYVTVDSDGRLYCFYEAQDRDFADGGQEAIGVATSDDGISWMKLEQNPVLSRGEADSWDQTVAKLPSGVVKYQGRFYLFYSGRNGEQKQIGVATASQLAGPWTRVAQNPVLTGRADHWDRVLSTHPAAIFRRRGQWQLLYRGMERRYAGQGLGLAVSDDLLNWRRESNQPLTPLQQEIASLAVVREQGRWVAISQPLDLSRRRYWVSDDLRKWTQSGAVNFRASVAAETLSAPFLFEGVWTVLYEQQDRIYRAVLQPEP